MNIVSRFGTIVVAALLGQCSAKSLPPSAPTASILNNSNAGDLLLINGVLFGHEHADAVWIRNGRIAKIGQSNALRNAVAALAHPTNVLDAQGGHVLPGLHDAHIHMEKGGRTLHSLQLKSSWNQEQVLAALKAYADEHPHRAWIRGRGWSYNMMPKGTYPTRLMLDAVVANRPVVLEAYDGHALWVNTQALEVANITALSPEPKNGTIVRQPGGTTPAGTLLETAQAAMLAAIPSPSIEERAVWLRTAIAHCLALGITSVTDMSYEASVIDVYQHMIQEDGLLPMRVHVGLPLKGDISAYVLPKKRYESERFRVGPLKGFLDGVVESRTALLLEPYANSTEYGLPRYSAEQLQERFAASGAHDFGIALHVVGDGAVRMALDAIEGAAEKAELAPRLEHIEVLQLGDAERMARLGVVASMQPAHANPGGDHPEQGVWAENLGAERLGRSFAWHTLEQAGVTLAFGSDWPVVSADPLTGIAVAITRQDKLGRPAGGWNPQERLSPQAAIHAYTHGSAHAVGRSHELGQLQPGYFGDIVVLDPRVDFAQPASLWPPSDEAHDNRVVFTVVGGSVVYSRYGSTTKVGSLRNAAPLPN